MEKAAFDSYLAYARSRGADTKGMGFFHGAVYALRSLPTLYGSYHPSPRNTFTGKLTRSMLLSLLTRIKKGSESFDSGAM